MAGLAQHTPDYRTPTRSRRPASEAIAAGHGIGVLDAAQ